VSQEGSSKQKQAQEHQKGPSSQEPKTPVQAAAPAVGLGRSLLQSGPNALSVPGWPTITFHLIHYTL
jgi:hypothetical protein